MTIASPAATDHDPFDELLALTADPATALRVCVLLVEARRESDPASALAWSERGLAIAERSGDPRLELDALRAACNVAIAPVPSHRAAELTDRLERLARRERSAVHLLHALLARRSLASASRRPSALRLVGSLGSSTAFARCRAPGPARSPLARATASGRPGLIADALSHALIDMLLVDADVRRPERRSSLVRWAVVTDEPRIPPSGPAPCWVRGERLDAPPPSALWLARLVLEADVARSEHDAAAGERLLDLLWPHRDLSGSLGDALGIDSIWSAIGAAAEAAGDLALATESYDRAMCLRPAGADPRRSLMTSVRHARVRALAA